LFHSLAVQHTPQQA